MKEEAASNEVSGWRKPSRYAGGIRMNNVSDGSSGRTFHLANSIGLLRVPV